MIHFSVVLRSVLLDLLSGWFVIFFFNDTATTEIYTLSLHDALPIFPSTPWRASGGGAGAWARRANTSRRRRRSEEHTSELQSPCNLVCRLLLEKKKTSKPRLSTSISKRAT